MFKEDLGLDKQQWLICHKTKTKPSQIHLLALDYQRRVDMPSKLSNQSIRDECFGFSKETTVKCCCNVVFGNVVIIEMWCNGYRRRKWTRKHEFKSWTRLIAFHIALIRLGKV